MYVYNSTECTPGSFGYNCSSTCGHCLNNSSCEPANGTCLQGCDPGFKTPLCIVGMKHYNPLQNAYFI